MKTWGIASIFILLLTFSAAPHASAIVIDFTATNLSGTTWRYDYTVTNDGSLVGGSSP
ncbi:hypothetical protein [Geobacter anodireducens]